MNEAVNLQKKSRRKYLVLVLIIVLAVLLGVGAYLIISGTI